MEENDIIIPLDIENLQENISHKLYKSTKAIVKSIVMRIIEIIISLIGIIALVPLTIVVFFQNLKNKDYGRIFYVQERIGKNGKTFKMFKFRTMVENADEILEAMLQDKDIKEEYEKYRMIQD